MSQKYRVGECLRCGKCCQTKHIYEAMNIFSKIHLLFKIYKAGKLKNFKSTHCESLRYRRGKAICKKYDNRPEHCKVYPEDHRLIKGCGYRIIGQKEYDNLPEYLKINAK